MCVARSGNEVNRTVRRFSIIASQLRSAQVGKSSGKSSREERVACASVQECPSNGTSPSTDSSPSYRLFIQGWSACRYWLSGPAFPGIQETKTVLAAPTRRSGWGGRLPDMASSAGKDECRQDRRLPCTGIPGPSELAMRQG